MPGRLSFPLCCFLRQRLIKIAQLCTHLSEPSTMARVLVWEVHHSLLLTAYTVSNVTLAHETIVVVVHIVLLSVITSQR